jgi:hypothetical protein
MAKYTGQVIHDAHPSFILCTEWISCWQHGGRILPKLPGPHSRLSRPGLDYTVSVNLQGTRADIDIDIFVNCSWVDTRWQYTFTHKQYIERHNWQQNNTNNKENNTNNKFGKVLAVPSWNGAGPWNKQWNEGMWMSVYEITTLTSIVSLKSLVRHPSWQATYPSS